MSPRPDLGLWPQLGYAASRVDRVAEKRTDADAMRALEADAAARWYVVGGELVAMRKNAAGLDPLFERAAAQALGTATHAAFLGLMNGVPRFALAIEPTAMEALKGHDGFEISDLRTIAVRGMVAEEHLPPLAEGKSLLIWHSRRRFCSNCGAETRVVDAGWRRDCPTCKMQHFPRTDPVVIMLAEHDGRLLLGRQPHYPPGRFSALAGFVEVGESIEDAVARELHEEAGIRVRSVRYLCSQPWPFPSSLMIGCLAMAEGHALTVDTNELDDARWFTRSEVAAAMRGDPAAPFLPPPPVAIARTLLDHWLGPLEEGGSGP